MAEAPKTDQISDMGSEELDLGEDPCGPTIWESAAHAEIPENAWEYHIRKANNDAAYKSLSYKPYCSTMPIPEKCENPKFMWTKKDK